MFLYSTCFQPRTESEQARAAKRLLKRQQARKRKLEEAGIKYDFDAVSYVRNFNYSASLSVDFFDRKSRRP